MKFCRAHIELVHVFMILNGSAHVFLNLNKNNKQSLTIYPGTHKKIGNVNVIKQKTINDFQFDGYRRIY
jgi:hypothetical protein